MGEPPVTFAAELRRLRGQARLTQEELAEAAALSVRSISDLERGVVTTPQKETVRLLADALRLIGPSRAGFEAVARGRAVRPLAGADEGPAQGLGGSEASLVGRERSGAIRRLVAEDVREAAPCRAPPGLAESWRRSGRYRGISPRSPGGSRSLTRCWTRPRRMRAGW